MNAALFKELISQLKVGKQLPDAVYLHKDALIEASESLQNFIPAVAQAVKVNEWDLVKLYKKEFRLSLLI